MAKKTSSSQSRKKYPERAADVPVTQAMLYLVRDELQSEISASKSELKADIKALESKFDRMQAELHRVALLVEEQNSKNNIVLDGLTNLFDRQERLESRVDKLENP